MQENTFIKNFLILSTGSALTIIIGLFTTPIITRIVDPTEYGQLSFFTMYANLALLILVLGLDQAFIRYFYQSQEIGFKRKLLYKSLWLPVVLSVIAALLVVTVGRYTINNIYQINDGNAVLALFSAYLIVLTLNRFSFLVVRLQYKTKLYASLNVLQKILFVLIVIALVLIFKSHYLLILVLATFLSQLIVTLMSIVKEKEIWKPVDLNYKIETTERELIKFGYPLVFSLGITWIFQVTDKLVIKKFGSFEDVGIYAGAMAIIALFSIIQVTFNTLWAPVSIEHFENNRDDKEFYTMAHQSITVLMFFFGLSLILFKDLFVLFLGQKYSQAAYIMPFLIFSPIMYTVSETTVGGINFMKKSSLHIFVAVGACVFNVVGCLVLVPIYGLRGAAISTGLSYVVFFILRTVLANQCYYINFGLRKFYALTSLTLIYAWWNTFHRFGLISIVSYIIICVIMFVLYKNVIKTGAQMVQAKLMKVRTGH